MNNKVTIRCVKCKTVIILRLPEGNSLVNLFTRIANALPEGWIHVQHSYYCETCAKEL